MTTNSFINGRTRREFLRDSIILVGAAAAARVSWALETNPLPRTLHPYPQKVEWGGRTLRFQRSMNLRVSDRAESAAVAMMKQTWQQFTLGATELAVTRDAALGPGEFTLAGAPPPSPEPDATYALTIGESGIGASAKDTRAMRHAWFTLLQLIEAEDASSGRLAFTFPHVRIQDWPALKFRGIHLCIFPETPPLLIEKAIRLAAFYKFTHVVLEFWGTLRLDALKELSWPDAWTKAQVARLTAIARHMGLEVIPMFNCWGHASGSRVKHGRHVVLDQNPRLAPLFEPDGWTWCLSNPRAQDLLRRLCDELIDLTGPGEYFHIGCDEAYSYATCDRCRRSDPVQLFADHINNLAAHLERCGRRAIIWGDALLERGKWPAGFTANGSPIMPTHKALDLVSRKLVIADWHYGPTHGEVPTLAYFRERGFETIACPWNSEENIRTLAKAAVKNQSEGLLMTTWHRLVQSFPKFAHAANCAWSQDQAAAGLRQSDWELMVAATATHLRKLAPAKGKFEHAGWNTFEMPAEAD